MLIVHRKLDKEIVFNSGKSFIEPEGMSDENGKLAVMERIGGSSEDYGTFRLHDIEDVEIVDEILAHVGYVSLIFEGSKAIGYEIDYARFETDKLLREEQELLDSLIPSKDEMLMAEVEIHTITILQEVGLI